MHIHVAHYWLPSQLPRACLPDLASSQHPSTMLQSALQQATTVPQPLLLQMLGTPPTGSSSCDPLREKVPACITSPSALKGGIPAVPHRPRSPTLLPPAGRGALFLADKRNVRELLLLSLRGIKEEKSLVTSTYITFKKNNNLLQPGRSTQSQRTRLGCSSQPPGHSCLSPAQPAPGAEVGWAHDSSPGCNVTAQVNYQQRCRV